MSSVPIMSRFALLAAALAAVVACAVSVDVHLDTGITELELHVEGQIGGLPPGLQAGPIAIYNDKKYELFDSDGDGLYDMARQVGATSALRIKPVGLPPSSALLAPASGPSTGPITGRLHEQERLAGLFYVNPPEVPIDFTARGTDLEQLDAFGYQPNQLLPDLLENVFEGNRARLELDEFGEIAGLYLDVTLHWNGSFGFPFRVEEFPAMGYNFHNVSDVPGALGHYWFLQVDGPAGSVLGWLARFGIEEIEMPLVTLSQPGAADTELDDLRVVIDAENQQAQGWEGTALLLSLDLE